MDWIFPIILALFTLILLWIMNLNNRLRRLRENVAKSWQEIDNQLKRRYLLLTDLLEASSSILIYEQDLIDALSYAKSQAESARNIIETVGGPTSTEGSLDWLLNAEKTLKEAITNFTTTLEVYPQLRSAEHIQKIEEELKAAENRIAFIRRSYNDAVVAYNAIQRRFPGILLAATFGHHPIHRFDI